MKTYIKVFTIKKYFFIIQRYILSSICAWEILMKYIRTLFEDADVQSMLHENRPVVEQAMGALQYFYPVMAKYIAENYAEFLDEDLESTQKNVYTFSTFATNHFLSECAAIYGRKVAHQEVLKEQARTEFI